jgi:hypothetical protein
MESFITFEGIAYSIFADDSCQKFSREERQADELYLGASIVFIQITARYISSFSSLHIRLTWAEKTNHTAEYDRIRT